MIEQPVNDIHRNRVNFMNKLKSDRQNIRMINKNGILVKFGDDFYYRIRNDFVDKDKIVENRYTASDQQLDQILSEFPEQKLMGSFEIINPEESKMKKAGGYLNHLYNYDMPKYGVFKKFNKSNYDDNCLVHALKYCDISEEQLTAVKEMVKGMLYIPTSSLKQISAFL